MKIDSYHHRRLFWSVSQIDIQRIMHGFLVDSHILWHCVCNISWVLNTFIWIIHCICILKTSHAFSFIESYYEKWVYTCTNVSWSLYSWNIQNLYESVGSKHFTEKIFTECSKFTKFSHLKFSAHMVHSKQLRIRVPLRLGWLIIPVCSSSWSGRSVSAASWTGSLCSWSRRPAHGRHQSQGTKPQGPAS